MWTDNSKSSPRYQLYFVLQTDDYVRSYGDPNLPGIPDDGVRQGSVTKENYERFDIGDEYCSEG